MTYEAYRARKFIPALDGLRAISVVLVISRHMHDQVWDWLNGWLGVEVFFVLSGYLITMLALREESDRGFLSFTAFFIRRSFRIFPLYYFILATYCLLILALGFKPSGRLPLLHALPYYLLYLQEIPFFYWPSNGTDGLPLFHSWSLGIEEKFYLVWPLLAFGLWRGRRIFRLACSIVLALSFAALPSLFRTLLGDAGIRLGSTLYPYCHILFGCVVALALHDRRWFDRLCFLRRRAALPTIGALLLAVHFTMRPLEHQFSVRGLPNGATTLYSVLTSILLIALLLGDGPLHGLLRWRPLTFVGRLSYGIYLVHILVLNVAESACRSIARHSIPLFDNNPETVSTRVDALAARHSAVIVASYCVAVVLSIGVAYVLHVVLERPCMNLGRRLSRMTLAANTPEDALGSSRSPIHD